MQEYTNTLFSDSKINSPLNTENSTVSGNYTESESTEQVKEIKFFSDPKTVKKKTQGSIIRFQLIFSGLICLLLKLTQAFTPELYDNINAYLERLFGW